jgi:hypothetical protein
MRMSKLTSSSRPRLSSKGSAGAPARTEREARKPGREKLTSVRSSKAPGLTLLLLAALFAGSLLPFSGSAQKPSVTAAGSRNAALVAATQEVLKETSEIRQLSILRPVRSSAQSRSEIERMIMKDLDQESTPGQMHATEVTLKKLGLAPPDFQYRALMVRLLTEQVAGYYEPKTGEFHLADWIDLDGQKPVMAHELTHALQDQHFNLRRFEHWPKGDSDAELAAHSLIEGDATLAMALYVANNPLRALLFLKSMGTSAMSSAELEKAPRAVRETLVFPYLSGIDWAKSLYKQNGWDRVSKAFTDLPQSTEQILHPDKYFAHDAPVKVALPDITALLNSGGTQRSGVRSQRSENQSPIAQARLSAASADVPSALSAQREKSSSLASTRSLNAHSSLSTPAWRRIDYDVEGEWGIYLILDEFLKAPAESRRAAAGWGGDRMAVYEGPKGEVLIASFSTWDTANDAREFFDAYVKRTELRYPGSEKSTNAPAPGTATAPKQSDRFWLRTSEGMIEIQLLGSRVLILEGVPSPMDPRQLAKATWLLDTNY